MGKPHPLELRQRVVVFVDEGNIRVWLGVIFMSPLIATYVSAGQSSAVTKMMFLLIAIPSFLFTL